MKGGGARSGLLMCALGLVIVACGGASEETAQFCEDYVTLNGLLSIGPDESDPMPWVEETVAGLEDLKESAPEQVSGTLTRMADSLLAPINALDEEAFFAVESSEEFMDDAATVSTYLEAECGFPTYDVTAVDYSFETDLNGIEPGTAAFRFGNGGSEIHEMALIRINDDTTESLDELLAMPEEEAMARTQFVGFAFGPPGSEDSLYVDLDTGRYVMLCFLPVGSTDMDAVEAGEIYGPPHFTQGMVHEFTVEG